MTNNYTASASEVLTMALKEGLDNVTIVGTKTYGKGVMQSKFNISDGSSIKLTVAYWTSPNGTSINGVGITPDVEIENHKALSFTGVNFDGESYEYDSVSTYTNIVQYALDYLGYDIERFDGYFDYSTRDALIEFKEEYGLESGLESDGLESTLDRDTYVAIISKVIETKSLDLSKDVQLMKGRELLGG